MNQQVKASIDSIQLPFNLTAEKITHQFLLFISQRYPSSDRLQRIAEDLGIKESIEAQIIVFSQFRDAIRQTSPRLYQSIEHRNEVLMGILDMLEQLETTLDEEFEAFDESEDTP